MSDPDDQLQSEQSTRPQTQGWRSERSEMADDDADPLINPDWRSSRINRSTNERRAGPRRLVPATPQDIPAWLQAGGWRIVAGVAAVLVILLAALLLLRQPRSALQTNANEQPTSAIESDTGAGASGPLSNQATVTVVPQPTQAPVSGGAFVVTGTETQGLFLRADHDTNSEILETLPESTRVTQSGEDFSGSDRVWRRVRAPSGKEGWVAVEWLQPTQ